VFSAGGKNILELPRHQVRKDYFSIFHSQILTSDLSPLISDPRLQSLFTPLWLPS